MCAFNRVNDTFNCQSRNGLQSLLKDDGKFDGWVVTDWVRAPSVCFVFAFACILVFVLRLCILRCVPACCLCDRVRNTTCSHRPTAV
eukprot:COSAG02_NODE_9811_length_2103_cov_1.258483_2_plen_87_part_00